MKEKQYKKYKEFYQADIDVIKKMIRECEKMSLVLRKTLTGKNHTGGFFIYIDKESKQ